MDDSLDQDSFASPQHHDSNRQIMLIYATSLSLVMLVVFSAYLYIRCTLVTRHYDQSRRTHRRRRRVTFTLHLPPDHTWIESSSFTTTIHTGLDPSLVAALPVFNVKGVDECVVCLSGLEDGETAKLLPNCKHSFHVGCIDTWLASHSTCPLCRVRVRPPLQPQPREGPTPRPLDIEPLVILEQPSSHAHVVESPKIGNPIASRLSSFQNDGHVDRDLERQ